MFFCVGENKYSACSIGVGDTIEQAIGDWAANDMVSEASEFAAEFEQYEPIIIEGRELKIEMHYQAPKFIELPT